MSNDRSRLRLALEWFLNPDHVPFVLGRELGWFAEEGIELELVEPAAHMDAFAALEAGDIEVAITEPIHLLQDRGEGHSVVGFARFLHTNGGVMYFAGRGISRPRDMVGKRVQYPGAPGPGGLAIVRTMIAADGGAELSASAPLVPVNRGFFHTDALAEGVADVATLAFFNFEVVEARHRGYDAQFFSLKDWGVPDFCQLILVTSERLLAERAHVFARLVKVLRRGVDMVHQEPDLAARIWAQGSGQSLQEPLNAAIFRATTACFTHDFSMSADYYAQLGAWLHHTGQTPAQGTLPVESAWTNALVLGSSGTPRLGALPAR